MELNLVYDTNILIYHFKNQPQVASYFKLRFLLANNVYVSVITRIELLSYSDITSAEHKFINDLLQYFPIIYLTREIENKTINIRKKYKLKVPDAVIAASAILNNAVLLTGNTGDFKKINEINVLNPFDKNTQ